MTSRASSTLSILCFFNSTEMMTLHVSHSLIHSSYPSHPIHSTNQQATIYSNRGAQHCDECYLFYRNKNIIQTSKNKGIARISKKNHNFGWFTSKKYIFFISFLGRELLGDSHHVTKFLYDWIEMMSLKYFHQRCSTFLIINSFKIMSFTLLFL